MESFHSLYDRLRTSLWLLPFVSLLISLGLGVWLSELEAALPAPLQRALFSGDAEAARATLQVVAGAIITVTGLVFSLTVLTLQVASSEYSPRLLRNFLQDRGNQIVLSIFLSTFVYCLMVLRTLQDAERVPELAMSVGLAFAIASVGALVYVIHHIAHSIRLDTIMREVEEATLAAIERNHPEQVAGAEWHETLPEIPERAVEVPARRSGIVQTLTPERLVRLAVSRDIVIRFAPRVGDSVVAGAPLAWVWARAPARPRPDADRLTRPVNRVARVGFERTLVQDVAFGLRQLVDLAIKGAAQQVVDPTTTVEALDHLAAVMTPLAGRRLGSRLLVDDTNQVRVAVPRRDFAAYLSLACDQPRRYAADEPAVAEALLHMLGSIGAGTRSAERRGLLASEVQRVMAVAEQHVADPEDLAELRRLADAVRERLASSGATPVTASDGRTPPAF